MDVKYNVANVLIDPRLFQPAPLVEMGDVDCGDRLVVRVWVPMGPAAYSLEGAFYDRLADTNVGIAGVDQISLMYLRIRRIITPPLDASTQTSSRARATARALVSLQGISFWA